MTLFILSCLTVVVVSSLCSIAEAVLLSLNPVRLETLKNQGKGYAGEWLKLKRNVDRPIAAILILNTVAHTGGATVAGSAFDATWGDSYIWVFSVVFTIVVLFGTEIVPKVIGVSYNTVLAPLVIRPLRFFIVVLRPIIFFTDILSRWLRRPGSTNSGAEVEAADLVTLAQLVKSRSLIDPSQERIIVNATKLQETKVQDVMLPAKEMVFFQIHNSLDENLSLARQALHTRYPVSETDGVEGVVGYVNFKEIFAIAPEDREKTIHSYLRQTLNVRAEDALSDVLRNLIAAKRHLAIVRAGDAAVVGMLTLEDVLEAIVGDIEDDLDSGSTDLISAGRGRWNVGGGVSLSRLKQGAGLVLGEGDAQTLSEFVEARLGRRPRPGQELRENAVRIIVLQVRRGRVYQALLERESEAVDPSR